MSFLILGLMFGLRLMGSAVECRAKGIHQQIGFEPVTTLAHFFGARLELGD
jgi:hypothetical protein